MSESRNTLYCSFCGKSQDEIRKLIAGPTVFICDECVLLCMDIVAESLIPERSAVELVTACPPGEMKAYQWFKSLTATFDTSRERIERNRLLRMKGLLKERVDSRREQLEHELAPDLEALAKLEASLVELPPQGNSEMIQLGSNQP